MHIALSSHPTAVRKLVEVLVEHPDFQGLIIDEEEAKQTQEALIAMSQLEHEVGDFLGLNQK